MLLNLDWLESVAFIEQAITWFGTFENEYN